MTPTLRLFHWTLGLVVLLDSSRAVARAGDPHVTLLASIEILAAVLFLSPRAVRGGAALLILVFAVAFVAHAANGCCGSVASAWNDPSRISTRRVGCAACTFADTRIFASGC